jgi:hypothetical protein
MLWHVATVRSPSRNGGPETNSDGYYPQPLKDVGDRSRDTVSIPVLELAIAAEDHL